MTATRRVLLVEDDAHIADLLTLHLRDEGLEVMHCARGDDGLRQLERGGWDALVLDIMLPGVDGLEICRRARAMARYTPIIIISARSSEVQRILGLEIGADDYLAKPFSVLELVARVKALLRRVEALAQNARLESGSLTIAGLAMDPVARDARLHGARLDLTPREFDLLYFFARQPGKVFSRMDLLNAVWGYQHEGYEHTVNTHINRLRAKIEADPAQPARILTVWGRGYKFAEAGRAPDMKLRLTLTQRLSLVFAVLLLVCSGTSAWMQLRASRMHELEVVQGLSRDVAESIARDAQLTDANGLMPGAVRSFFNQLMLVNPSVEVYLLDADGRIAGHAAPTAACAASAWTWPPCTGCWKAARCPSWATTRAASKAARSSARRRCASTARRWASSTWCCRARRMTSWWRRARPTRCSARRCGPSAWWRCCAWWRAWWPLR